MENGKRLDRCIRDLDKADHLLRDDNHSRYAGAMIAAWAQLYL